MKLNIKLIISFLAMALIPMIVMGVVGFYSAQLHFEAAGQNKVSGLAGLEAIADLKVKEIETFFKNVEGHMKIAQDYFNIRSNVPKLNQYYNDKSNREYVESKKDLDSQLRTFREVTGLIDLILLSKNGTILYTTENIHTADEIGLEFPDKEAFEEGKKDIYFGDIFPAYVEGTNFEMLVTGPIYDFNDTFIGVIVFAINMDPVYEFIQDTTGLGDTGETLIGKDNGNHALFLNPLRHDPYAALERKASYKSQDALPIRESTRGIEGSGATVDYRPVPILAAWRYIPFMEWGLVSKIDREEVFAPISNIKKILLSIGVVLFLLAGIVAIFISKFISHPIDRLTKSAGEIASGNLEVEIDSKLKESKGEISELSSSFERMVSEIKGAKSGLEGQVKKRTKELQMKIEELKKFNMLSVGRELKMIELKKKIKKLEKQLIKKPTKRR